MGNQGTFAPRIILNCPINDESKLPEFVDKCLIDSVSLVAAFGPGSPRIHDILDELIVGDGSDHSRFFCTTWHEQEPLEDVVNMLKYWKADGDGVFDVVSL